MLNMPMQQVCFLQVSLDPRSTDSGNRLRIITKSARVRRAPGVDYAKSQIELQRVVPCDCQRKIKLPLNITARVSRS